jgi:outer membrane protein assembly factor BamB
MPTRVPRPADACAARRGGRRSAPAAVIATEELGLAFTLEGWLVLFETKADELRERGRVHLLPEEKGLYSHPALVGTRLTLRGSTTIECHELG